MILFPATGFGTGSAYQACVLAEMGAQVYTIERQKKLFDDNKKFDYLKKYPTIKFFYGDGFEGLPTYGPFDKILITAAAPLIPQKLIEQLKPATSDKPGGSMVLPLVQMKSYRSSLPLMHRLAIW